jgi:serine/threonine protein kinase
LLSIIPVEDFPVPAKMGADQIVTGGRTGYLKGPGHGITQEACEAIDLLSKLLEKDPVKRITLADVKVSKFGKKTEKLHRLSLSVHYRRNTHSPYAACPIPRHG